MVSNPVPIQLVVLCYTVPNPEMPGYETAYHRYGELHKGYVLFCQDRKIPESSIKQYHASPDWIAYAKHRELIFQVRTGTRPNDTDFKRAIVKDVPYMFDIDGYMMPVFEIENGNIVNNYHPFYRIEAPTRPTASEPPPPTGPAPRVPR
jgi:hypothetical protein